MAEKLISVGRIVVGVAGKDRQVIEPGAEVDPAEAGLDDEEVGRLLDSGALRRAPEPEAAPADGPREQAPPAGNTPAPGESEVISREPPSDERPA